MNKSVRRVSSDGSAVDFGLEDPEFEPRWFHNENLSIYVTVVTVVGDVVNYVTVVLYWIRLMSLQALYLSGIY